MSGMAVVNTEEEVEMNWKQNHRLNSKKKKKKLHLQESVGNNLAMEILW